MRYKENMKWVHHPDCDFTIETSDPAQMLSAIAQHLHWHGMGTGHQGCRRCDEFAKEHMKQFVLDA